MQSETVFVAAFLVALAITWIAHMAVDRVSGYGLESEEAPQVTHISVRGAN